MRHLPATWSVMYSVFYKRSLGENNPGNTIFRHHLLLLRIMKRKQESLSQSNTLLLPLIGVFMTAARSSRRPHIYVHPGVRPFDCHSNDPVARPLGRGCVYINILGTKYLYVAHIWISVWDGVRPSDYTHTKWALCPQNQSSFKIGRESTKGN